MFIEELSSKLGKNNDETKKILSEIANVLASFCSDCDSVSIPGFGTFTTTKKDEFVATSTDGKRILMPPCISVDFKPSVVLRKSIN